MTGVGRPADRMPPLADDQLTDVQRAAVEAVTSGPRGKLLACFEPLLRSPEMLTRVQAVGEYIRYQSILDDDLVELVILCVARHWDQEFEWAIHQPIALEKGLPPEVVQGVGEGRRPAIGRVELAAVWDLVSELQERREVSDAVYDVALGLLGEEKLVEVLGTTGYYTTLAMVMNGVRTPPPPGAVPLPARARS